VTCYALERTLSLQPKDSRISKYGTLNPLTLSIIYHESITVTISLGAKERDVENTRRGIISVGAPVQLPSLMAAELLRTTAELC